MVTEKELILLEDSGKLGAVIDILERLNPTTICLIDPEKYGHLMAILHNWSTTIVPEAIEVENF